MYLISRKSSLTQKLSLELLYKVVNRLFSYSVLTIAGIKTFLSCCVVGFSVGFCLLLHTIHRLTPLEKDWKPCLVAL